MDEPGVVPVSSWLRALVASVWFTLEVRAYAAPRWESRLAGVEPLERREWEEMAKVFEEVVRVSVQGLAVCRYELDKAGGVEG